MLETFLAQAQTAASQQVPGGGIGSFFLPLIFIVMIMYFLISRRQKTGAEQQQKKLGGAGRLLVGVGVAIAGYFFFVFDTSVGIESHYVPGYGNIGSDRVNNFGRMQDRNLGFIAGIAMAVVGAIMVVSEKKS